MGEIDDAVMRLEKALAEEGVDPQQGLPESVFIMASSLVPIVNIDLFIVDGKDRVLLSWRDDLYHAKGWHIPGGCLRIQETLTQRIKQTALAEIGTEVAFVREPVTVREGINGLSDRPWLKNPLERSHNISFLYFARLREGFQIDNKELKMHDRGYLKWFSEVPPDLLPAHEALYLDVLNDWFQGKKGIWEKRDWDVR